MKSSSRGLARDLWAKRMPEAAASLRRLHEAFVGLRAALRRRAALNAVRRALRLDGAVLMEIAFAGLVAAGFTITKNGQEYAVFVGDERVTPVSGSAEGVAVTQLREAV